MKIVIFSSPQRKHLLDELLSTLTGKDVTVIDSPVTFGKENFWRRWNEAREVCLSSKYDNYAILHDDISSIDWIEVNEVFKRFRNKPFACALKSDDRTRCWNSKETKRNNYTSNIYKFTDIGFFDCCGITNRVTMQRLECNPVPLSWFDHPRKSSGVGAQLTRKMQRYTIPMYVTTPSLAAHGHHESVMHPEERKEVPLIARTKLKVVVAIATYANRDIKPTINSLASQVDVIRIYDNEKREVNLTDNGKFYFLQEYKEPVYYFTCDDDIIYPPTYVRDMIAAIERTGTIVTHHGRLLTGGLNANYYKGHKPFRCMKTNHSECLIDIAGTGVTAWRTDYFNPVDLYKDPRHKMTDILIGIEAVKQGKKITVLRHEYGYFKENAAPIEHQIYWQQINTDQREQIEGCNELLRIKASLTSAPAPLPSSSDIEQRAARLYR